MKIHPSAIVHPKAELDESVEVGPYAIIGEHVRIGAGTVVQAHAFIDGHTTIGRNCKIFPFTTLGMPTQDLKYDGGTTYAEIGDGTTIREYTSVHLGTRDGEVTRVGKDCLIMAYCHIAHGCTVGNGVIMSNLAQLAGEAQVEDCAIIAGMVGVHQFVRVGTLAMVGATRVLKDVPPYMLVGNSPAEVCAPNIVGLQRHGIKEDVRSAIKKAFKILYRDGYNRLQAIEHIRSEVMDCPEIRHLTNFVEQSTRGTL